MLLRLLSRRSLMRAAPRALAAAILVVSCFAAPLAATNEVSVSGAWSRPATDTGVVYLSIRNDSAQPDRLVRAASPVARTVELHETVERSMASMPIMGKPMRSMGPNSMSMMKSVPTIRIPANGTVVLKPGGYHIMLIGLKHPLAAGQTFPVHLQFAHAGVVTVAAHVRGMR
jgi:periplasmic copper chaperone A